MKGVKNMKNIKTKSTVSTTSATSMKAGKIVEILSAAIPISETWGGRESYGANFLVNNNNDIKKILYCVTATREVVQYFQENGYDLLISHHPFGQSSVPQLIYHTALDCCKGGLNDMWRDFLEMKNAKHFSQNLGWVGEIDPISFDDLVAKVEAWLGYKAIGKKYSDGKMITSVVICTGLGGLVYDEAANTGADCYITGELTSSTTHGFNAILETGHTISEFIGIYLIRKLLPGIQIDSAPMDIDYFSGEFHKEYSYSKEDKVFKVFDAFDTHRDSSDSSDSGDYGYGDYGNIEEIIKWADDLVDSGEHIGPKPSTEKEDEQLFWAIEILTETGKI